MLAFSSGRVLKPSVRMPNNTSPFVLVEKNKRNIFSWEKNVFEKSCKSFLSCADFKKFNL